MSIQVVPLKDSNALFPMALGSTSKHITARREVQFLPTEQTTFAFGGNQQIIFNISSATEFMNGNDSYLTFNLQTSSNAAYTKKSLNVGGAHALFRNVEIRMQNGQLIERIERYNKNYAVVSMANHSRDHIEWIEHTAGDSVSGVKSYDDGHCGQGNFITGEWTVTTGTRNAVWASAVVPAGWNELALGDEVEFVDGEGKVIYRAFVDAKAVVAGASVTLTIRNSAEGNFAGTIPDLKIRKVSSKPQRAVYADNNVHEVSIKLMSGFINNEKYIPLKYMKQGLQIVLTLDDPRNVMTLNQTVLVPLPNLGYTITQPRYYASMITYDAEMDKIHMDMFNSSGLKIEWQSYFHRLNIQNNGEPGEVNFSNNIGRRSCRSILTVIQPSWTENKNNRSFNYDYCGQFMRSGMVRYQYQVGSEQFPYREVKEDAGDSTMSRTLSQLQMTTRKHGGTLFDTRFCPSEWRSVNFVPGLNATAVAATTRAESLALILSSRLDRDNSPWSGVNTEISPLEILVDFTGQTNFEAPIDNDGVDDNVAVPASRYIHSFIAFDAVCSVSSSGSIILN